MCSLKDTPIREIKYYQPRNYAMVMGIRFRFSSLFAAGEVSRETPSSAKSEGKRMFWQATNAPKILDLKSCSKQIFFEN